MSDFRVEHDTLGEVRVPTHAKWAAQTQRAVDNFPVSGLPVDQALIRSLARLKGAAAIENARLQLLDPDRAAAIRDAAAEVTAGRWDREFPVDVYQTGSGTSSNMNMNEVLATLATERLATEQLTTLETERLATERLATERLATERLATEHLAAAADRQTTGVPRTVHPNDHVNASQSSNDVFPSAIHLAAVEGIAHHLIPSLGHLAEVLRDKARQWQSVVKAGRTHLMDATPVTLGQEFGGYASAIEHGIERLEAALPRVGELPLGGTAVGTGLNAPEGFAAGVIARLAAELALPLTEARDHFEAQGGRDALVEASGALRTVAISLYKCANDIRWMGSGPRCGLAEIHIPDLQPGSSIMPGKVNPVMAEAVCQVVAQVVGNDAAIAFAGAAGNFELNIMLPVMGRNLLESIRLLSTVSRLFADKCVAGIEADVDRARHYALSSPAIATALNPYIGYEEAARVVKVAAAERKDLRTVVLERGLMTPEEVDRVLDPEAMTRGGILK